MAKKRKTLLHHLSSPLTMGPMILGSGAAAYFWAKSDQQLHLAAFAAITGSLIALGFLFTLLVIHSRNVGAAVLRRRQEMRRLLDELADAGRYPAAPESDRVAADAGLERD
jgi:hypothetical protein